MEHKLLMNDRPNADVDLTTCDLEPIHLLGQVQSFGFLLGLTSDWIIAYASDNVTRFLPADAVDDLLGQPVSQVLDQRAIHSIRNRLQNLGARTGVEIAAGVEVGDEGRLYDVSIHVSGRTIILEFEPTGALASVQEEIANVQDAIQRTAAANSIADALNFAVRFVKAMGGYDRVMAYRFLPDDSGEVVAEAVAPGMEPFLNLRYPASDIPKQARALYIRNPIALSPMCMTMAFRSCRAGPLGWICRMLSCEAFHRSIWNICAIWAWAHRCRFRSSSIIPCGA